MKILLRIGLVVIALFVVALAALAVFLPSIIEGEEVRRRIASAAEKALGRELRFAELDIGLLPPSLVVVEPRIAGATPGSPPLAEADAVSLRVALLPLLARTVVVDSLMVEGATLRLVRGADGIELPRPAAAESAGAGAGGAPTPDEAGSEASVALAVRGLELRDATLILEDRVVSPAVTWELRDLALTARGKSLGEPLRLDGSGSLASGGSFSIEGSASHDGEIDLSLSLDALALAPVGSYVDGASDLGGELSGTIAAQGPAANPTRIAVDLRLHKGTLVLDEIAMRGRLGLKADLAGGLDAPSGNFDIDATDAEVRYGEVFTKPPGKKATVRGRIVGAGDGTVRVERVRLEPVNLELFNLSAEGSVRLGDRVRIALEAPAFDVAGWEELLPALAGYELSGPMALSGLTVTTAPLDVRGTIGLAGLRAVLPDQGPVSLTGAIVGEGNSIRTRDLVLLAADQRANVEGTVQLGPPMRYSVRVRADDADANRLMSVFTRKPDTLYGLLALDGNVAGSVREDKSLLETAAGQLRVDIDDGRIVGTSLLKATFDQLGSVGSAAVAAGRVFGGRDLQRFYGDDFETIEGTLKLGAGIVTTDDLRIVYRDYRVELWGNVKLADLALDMRGKLTIFEKIDEALKTEGGAQAQRPAQRSIPLAAVGGTLDRPRIKLTAETVTAFVSSYALGGHRDELEKVIDKNLGDGAGKQVIDVLEGVLGGRRRD